MRVGSLLKTLTGSRANSWEESFIGFKSDQSSHCPLQVREPYGDSLGKTPRFEEGHRAASGRCFPSIGPSVSPSELCFCLLQTREDWSYLGGRGTTHGTELGGVCENRAGCLACGRHQRESVLWPWAKRINCPVTAHRAGTREWLRIRKVGGGSAFALKACQLPSPSSPRRHCHTGLCEANTMLVHVVKTSSARVSPLLRGGNNPVTGLSWGSTRSRGQKCQARCLAHSRCSENVDSYKIEI